ncbi:MAG: hypothetical protein AB1567_06455 [bacterium]
MPEQLGKIEKPIVETYKTGRKLYFVPLIFTPQKYDDEFLKIANKYWEEVQTQLTDLETKLGTSNKIYHELVPIGGEDGVKLIEELSKGSCQIVKSRLDKGAKLELIEDRELLAEFMDWSKCLLVELELEKVFDMVYAFYTDALQKRNKYIEQQIDETLKENEAGILLMQELHQIQFPQGLEVFYIAPPSLDEIRRWIRTHVPEI